MGLSMKSWHNLLLAFLFWLFNAPLWGQTSPPIKKIGHPPLMSPHAAPIVSLKEQVFVVNTPADTVDVINTHKGEIVKRIPVGIDPVSLAIRPDGKELWVSNHVSDSVSVIDNNPQSTTYLHVVDTIQHFNSKTKATTFDEPVGIAFANNAKAYVALSSENQIAVIDVASRKVTKRLRLTAQDPRAIKVRNGKLYVIPFESNNKTQLSGGYDIDGKLITFNAHDHSIANNNVLSIGHVTDIVKHPRVPDKDLYIFNTETDKLEKTVHSLGTLLYGMAVDSKGRVFIAQTDARNDANGRVGTEKHGLAELENRAFLNQITKVSFNNKSVPRTDFWNLEPLPPKHPQKDQALATPFGIQISEDDSTLFVTAAGSDKVFSMDAKSGKVLGRVSVDAVPRGLTLQSSEAGKPTFAWVLNAVANTVSKIDVSNPAKLLVKATIALKDPTHPTFKRGRIAFNTASASSTGTFSCASCHPDGHTDQLLWVLKTPIVTGGNQIMPRSTMPVRGLRDTAPFHWDGIPGDPYGGNNSANVHKHDLEPNSDIKVPESTTRHLVDGGLASTMKAVKDPVKNDEGKAGLLSKQERDDLAKFLLSVSYPPAQKRSYTNELSERAKEGFELFHIKGNHEGKPQPNACGDCHRMPFWVSTNSPGTGMDAPTWRGAYDRFLILPQGRLNIIDFPFYKGFAEEGIPERKMWRLTWRNKPRFDPVWNMVLEGSTGFSGAFARQVTLNSQTAKGQESSDLINALEKSSNEGAIVLQVEGVFLKGKKATPTILQFDKGHYVETSGDRQKFSREALLEQAKQGTFVGTFTGRHGEHADYENPQPAIWTEGPIQEQRGKQRFPKLSKEETTMIVSGRHIHPQAHLIVNGRKVEGELRLEENERLQITLHKLPEIGLHFLQLQNPDGLFSNDFTFHVTDGKESPEDLLASLRNAIQSGNLEETKKIVEQGVDLNAHGENGGTALSAAAFHGRPAHARFLLNQGAKVTVPNRDGNTPLHVAAFMGRSEIVKLYLNHGASLSKENDRKETPLDVVSGEWDEGLEGFYRTLNNLTERRVEIDKMPDIRPQMAQLLRNHKVKK